MDALKELKDRLVDYLLPLAILAVSIVTLFIALLTRPLLLLRSPSAFRFEWFRRFFVIIGPAAATEPNQRRAAERALASASGTVLDIGPGLGHQLPLLTPHAAAIERVYGLEPTLSLHEALRAKAAECGLGDKYVVLGAGASPDQMIPALHKAGVQPRSLDVVVSIKSLCSCPHKDVPSILQAAQGMLKSGGEYVFLEHVENRRDTLTGWYQWALNYIWPAFAGGCRLDGTMDLALKAMDGWESIEVRPLEGQKAFASIPYVTGRAVKA